MTRGQCGGHTGRCTPTSSLEAWILAGDRERRGPQSRHKAGQKELVPKAGSSGSEGGPRPGGPKGRFLLTGAEPASPITWGRGPSLGLPDTNHFRRFKACPYHPRSPLEPHRKASPTPGIIPAVSSGQSPRPHTRALCHRGLKTDTACGAGWLRSPRCQPATGGVSAGKHTQVTAVRERRAPSE